MPILISRVPASKVRLKLQALEKQEMLPQLTSLPIRLDLQMQETKGRALQFMTKLADYCSLPILKEKDRTLRAEAEVMEGFQAEEEDLTEETEVLAVTRISLFHLKVVPE